MLLLNACKSSEAPQVSEAPEVKVQKLQPQDLSLAVEYVGQTKGAVDAEIRARVEGVILGVHFKEGKEVKEGDLLYTIDPAPFEAKKAEAQAKLSEAVTRLAKADSDLARIKPLAEMKAVSQRDLDSAIAQQGVAKGSVEAATAFLESAKIELGYTRISAPISGLIGLTKARVGEFVGRAPNTVVLNTISQLDPIHVRFSISEKDYLYFAKLKQAKVKNGEVDSPFQLTLVLSDGSILPAKGEVASVDSQVDATTGSLAVEASFPNADKLIRPGQFAKIRTVGQNLKDVIAIPKKSIRDLQGIKQVAVVASGDVIEVRTVKTGQEVGDQVIVLEGLVAGDTIVSESQARLKSGTQIRPIS